MVELHQQQGHVVVLGRGGGEAVGFVDDVAQDGAGVLRQVGARGGDHAFLAPFLVLQVERFADAVGVGEQQVAGLEEQAAFLVEGIGQQADDGPPPSSAWISLPRRT